MLDGRVHCSVSVGPPMATSTRREQKGAAPASTSEKTSKKKGFPNIIKGKLHHFNFCFVATISTISTFERGFQFLYFIILQLFFCFFVFFTVTLIQKTVKKPLCQVLAV